MSDIVVRLRRGDFYNEKDMLEAADEITRLRAENAKLLERLEKAHSFISRADWMQFFEEEHAAAIALKETGDE